ncbi:MAG TPA: class I SAM-dependent methyltransferase [Salinivirga sp.]|uniref:class I SAM-dependent methyltransferase n=1 Tax=Salinivirga sp. TaxID=1970192 RepID=UPI002B46E529|nr:class I SAM-dependent methyltransferase [Salinivirga sp.]HKK58974.1 class I SAM-dependent methyltransferase [Salinivirga sp.]
MNVFAEEKVAQGYDDYYNTEFGKKVGQIEEQLVRELMQEIPQIPLLELGCGTGHWTRIFLNMGYEVTATDVAEPMLRVIRTKELKINIRELDAMNLPFENNSLELIAGITMLEFVNDQQKVIDEIFRVLKPGGWLVLGCLNEESALGKTADNDPVFKHAKFLDTASLKQKLGSFKRVEINSGVHFSENFEIMDGKPEAKAYAPAFMAVLAQKS